jgi:hypothetical protein
VTKGINNQPLAESRSSCVSLLAQPLPLSLIFHSPFIIPCSKGSPLEQYYPYFGDVIVYRKEDIEGGWLLRNQLEVVSANSTEDISTIVFSTEISHPGNPKAAELPKGTGASPINTYQIHNGDGSKQFEGNGKHCFAEG